MCWRWRRSLQIIEGCPPNFEDILRIFPAARIPGVVFAYGNVLYNPSGVDILTPLLAHEQIHAVRQLAIAGGPAAWWAQYLVDQTFCYTEELLAHQAEFKEFCEHHTKGRARFLAFIAHRLSGPLYGYTVTFEKAKRAIKWPGGADCP